MVKLAHRSTSGSAQSHAKGMLSQINQSLYTLSLHFDECLSTLNQMTQQREEPRRRSGFATQGNGNRIP